MKPINQERDRPNHDCTNYILADFIIFSFYLLLVLRICKQTFHFNKFLFLLFSIKSDYVV